MNIHLPELYVYFHVIEHLPNPKVTLRKLQGLLAEGGKIYIETPNADDALIGLYKNKSIYHCL